MGIQRRSSDADVILQQLPKALVTMNNRGRLRQYKLSNVTVALIADSRCTHCNTIAHEHQERP